MTASNRTKFTPISPSFIKQIEETPAANRLIAAKSYLKINASGSIRMIEDLKEARLLTADELSELTQAIIPAMFYPNQLYPGNVLRRVLPLLTESDQLTVAKKYCHHIGYDYDETPFNFPDGKSKQAFTKFYDEFEKIRNYVTAPLKEKELELEMRHCNNAKSSMHTLRKEIDSAICTYLNNGKTAENGQILKKAVDDATTKAAITLHIHRGRKDVFANIAFNLLFCIPGLVHLYKHGTFFIPLTKTDSLQKLEEAQAKIHRL